MVQADTVYYSTLDNSKWPIILAATDKGFCFMGSLNKDKEELFEWMEKTGRKGEVIHSAEKLAPYAEQLNEYFDGKRQMFDLPLDASGTPFQEAVWNALLQIPYGETRTYSDIAQTINRPRAIRAAASAVGRNPAMVFIPCHRIIHKNGSINGFRGSNEMKKHLLEIEKSSRFV